MSKSKLRPAPDFLRASATHLLHRALQKALDLHAEAGGPGALTQRQFTVLAATAAGEGLTQNDLVRATGIDRSTLADLVARMLAKGLLMRARSTTDARANSVRLSEAGRAALDAGWGPTNAADERLLAQLSPKKREAFLKMLGAVAHVEEAAAGRAKSGKTSKPEKATRKAAGKSKKGKKAKKAKPFEV